MMTQYDMRVYEYEMTRFKSYSKLLNKNSKPTSTKLRFEGDW